MYEKHWRMVGDLVVNERHLRRIISTNRSIGMGSYNMDSHNVQRYVDEQQGTFATRVIFKSIPVAHILSITVQSFRREQNAKKSICCLCSIHVAYRIRFSADGTCVYDPWTKCCYCSIACDSTRHCNPRCRVHILAKRLMADGQVLEYTTQKNPQKILFQPLTSSEQLSTISLLNFMAAGSDLLPSVHILNMVTGMMPTA